MKEQRSQCSISASLRRMVPSCSAAWTSIAAAFCGGISRSRMRGRLPRISTRPAVGLTRADIYPLLARHGLDYGPGFQVISDIRFSGDRASARVRQYGQSHITGLWDASFQAAALLSIHNGTASQRQFVPFHLDHMQLRGDLAQLATIHLCQLGGGGGGDVLRFDIACYDAAGRCLAQFGNFSKRAYARPTASVAAPAEMLPAASLSFPLESGTEPGRSRNCRAAAHQCVGWVA